MDKWDGGPLCWESSVLHADRRDWTIKQLLKGKNSARICIPPFVFRISFADPIVARHKARNLI